MACVFSKHVRAFVTFFFFPLGSYKSGESALKLKRGKSFVKLLHATDHKTDSNTVLFLLVVVSFLCCGGVGGFGCDCVCGCGFLFVFFTFSWGLFSLTGH